MSNITLGLDIGQYSIKGVRPGKKGIRTRPGCSFEKRLPRDQASDPFTLLSPLQQTALKELVAEGTIRPSDTIAVALPGHLLSIREITLPFTNAQKIRKTAYYEAEQQLPFNVEDAILDYHVLASTDSVTHVLVFAVSKVLLKEYLEKLLSVGIDPVIVSVDQIALYHAMTGNLMNTPVSEEKSRLVIDIGATKTVLCYLHDGTLEWARTTPVGVDFFVDLLKEEYALSWTDAERQFSQIDQPQQGDAMESLLRQVGPWVTDMEVRLTQAPATSSLHLYSGAPASVGKIVSQALHREVFLQNHYVEGMRAPSAPAFVQALGLTQLPVHAINFRRYEFTHKDARPRRNFVPLGMMVVLLLILTGVNLYLHTQQKEKTYKTLKATLRNAFKTAFPDVQQVVDEVKQAEIAMTELRKQSDFLGLNGHAPLLILKQIAEAIPPEVKIFIIECDIEQKNAQISAHTTSFQAVDQIRTALMHVPSFDKVSISDTQVTEDLTHIRFRIHITLKATDRFVQNAS